MATSQNGWTLVGVGQLDSSPIPGTNVVPVPGVFAGDVATLLHWVGVQFNSKVETLYNPGCWGWNVPTPIPGSNVYSNHCSGTAIDFNAPSFPWTLDKMSEGQKQACRNIVAQTEGVVVWGGDFTTKIDQMHFEINGTAEDVARIVKKLGVKLMDREDAINSYQSTFHRYPSEAEIQGRIGKKYSEVAAEERKSPEWREIDTELTLYQGMVNAKIALLKQVSALEAMKPSSDAQQKLDKIKELLK